jgi:hypothetical protein
MAIPTSITAATLRLYSAILFGARHTEAYVSSLLNGNGDDFGRLWNHKARGQKGVG